MIDRMIVSGQIYRIRFTGSGERGIIGGPPQGYNTKTERAENGSTDRWW